MYEIEKSVARLPLRDQVPEIEKRLALLYRKQKAAGRAMTPAHVAEALAINKGTLTTWTRRPEEIDPATIGTTPDDVPVDLDHLDGLDDIQLKEARRQVLRLWLTKGETLTVDIATSPDSKSAVTGAVKILETAYDYRKKEEVKLTAGGGWERLINSIK